MDKFKSWLKKPKGMLEGVLLGFILALILVTVSQNIGCYFTQKDLSKFNTIAKILNKTYTEDYNHQQLVDGAARGIMDSLDGYSSYMSKEDYDKFLLDEDMNYCGIGIRWQLFEYYTIVKVFEGGPADKAGLKVGDLIYAINGKNCKMYSRDELQNIIRGEAGTTVDLTIIHNEQDKEYTITREPINIPYAWLDVKDDVAIITIEAFENEVVEQFHDCINQVNDLGITNLVIDLRGNTGGDISLLQNIMSDILLEDTDICTLKRKDGSEMVYTVKSNTDKKYNISILMNESTASCSEIMSGSLRNLGYATLYGNHTYGKGVIQDCIQMKDGSMLFVTSGHYYLPNNEEISKDGLLPDYEVDDNRDTIDDEQLDYVLSQIKGN